MKYLILGLVILIGCGDTQSSLKYDGLDKIGVGKEENVPDGAKFSSLYPLDWEAGFKNLEGEYLQDYSYAGYKNSEVSISYKVNQNFNVLSYGADKTGLNDSSGAIAQAIAAAEANQGGIVYFPNGQYLIKNLIKITKSNVVLLGESSENTKLYFNINGNLTDKHNISFEPSNYQSIFVSNLTRDALVFDKSINLDSLNGLEKGDDIIIGAKISTDFQLDHSMQSYWTIPKDKWRPFFRRNVLSANPGSKSVEFKVPVRYDLKIRDEASVYKETGLIQNCGVSNLSLSNASTLANAEASNRHHLIKMFHAKNCFIKNVKTYAGKSGEDKHLQSGGILISNSKNITIQDSDIRKAQNIQGGGNGYLYEILQSNEVLVKNSKGFEGRHNFIQNWDFSTNGCVFLNVHSSGGKSRNNGFLIDSYSEFHHSLALANLIDSSTLDDGWVVWNRKSESSNSGHAGTQNVFWNTAGNGKIISYQFGKGYIIGTAPSIEVKIDSSKDPLHNLMGRGENTQPLDIVELEGEAQNLYPQSLFLHQLSKRL